MRLLHKATPVRYLGLCRGFVLFTPCETMVRMLDHLSIQCADVIVSAAFYDQVLGPLGGGRILEVGDEIGYGIAPKPSFWIGPRLTGKGFRESHSAFAAESRHAVDAFFAAAVGLSAEVLYEPQLCPAYHEHYYAAFVRDPDGNNVEAVCHRPE